MVPTYSKVGLFGVFGVLQRLFEEGESFGCWALEMETIGRDKSKNGSSLTDTPRHDKQSIRDRNTPPNVSLMMDRCLGWYGVKLYGCVCPDIEDSRSDRRNLFGLASVWLLPDAVTIGSISSSCNRSHKHRMKSIVSC